MKLSIGLLIFVLGCSSVQLTPAGQLVQQFQGRADKSCTRLGTVQGQSSSGSNYESIMYNAKYDLKNNTARMGGNYVRITDNQTSMVSQRLSGVAYKCPANVDLDTDVDPIKYGPSDEAIDSVANSVQSKPTKKTHCGIQPIPKYGCYIGHCVDGEWQQICD